MPLPKLFVFDEAWRFFRNPTTRAYIVEALKTWRKRNAAMICATQSGDDLLREEMLAVIAESCMTKIFLANPGMDARSLPRNLSSQRNRGGYRLPGSFPNNSFF